MTPSTPSARLPHVELDPPAKQRSDCRAVGEVLRLGRIARAAADGPPSLRFEDFPREVAKREIEISEAAARIAGALHLHLD